ncbi:MULTISPECIES: DUF86 domain-containing protein [unclassified Imperialibacter]|uniref:HepT-like ribonuclease domain-containing protein n=1 Tax=unclassified Imperialibacter TaxID=2629706 RepID=UPI001259B43E|nr:MULTISPECIES: DUF86 domain-containing protein [unclassified Imperialibacter]CAD5281671.1 conserved hypothetical protein [Imperialibacter sp. 89]CAD5287900.1 conserved hypothetical protein [Imperialibacter sp. 75]VVT31061.1 conserved hypothetical protein [Imperialibacter sp. EC-SDR9]
MAKNTLVYLEHILDALAKVKSYTTDLNEGLFLENPLVQDAVIRNFEVIGEATKQIDLGIRAKYPDIEWKKIAGMRDKLIHDYIGVDLRAVWAVVENLVPDLEKKIEEIVKIEKG